MAASEKIKVKRVPKRGSYDRETIYRILDKEFVCHVGFIHEGYPVVIPTLYGRQGDSIYLHGSMASRMMKNLSQGLEMCVTVTLINGLVLARSAFHHSANYESVVLFGKAIPVDDPVEKNEGLRLVSEHIIPGRWEECRQPNAKELKGTMLLKISIDEASAKIRVGGPVDDKEDYDLDIWAGVLPIVKKYGNPVIDPLIDREMELPGSVMQIRKAEKI